MARILRQVIALLNRLIQLSHGTMEACTVARDRVVDADLRERLGATLADHRRHVEELSNLVRNLGGEPAGRGDLRQVLVRGRVALGALVGDGAVLEALRGAEVELVEAYDEAASQPGIPVDVVSTLERHLVEERGHCGWIADRLDRAVAAPTH